MHPTFVVGILLQMVTLSQVSGEMVNLWNVAQQYIDALNITMKNITSWGLTDQYPYWKTSHNTQEKVYPITANVSSITCEPPINEYDRIGPEHGLLLITYVWNLTKQIYCPFPVSTKVQILIGENKAFKKKSITLTINNRTLVRKAAVAFRGIRLKGKDIRLYRESCRFSAKVTFNGFSSYQTESRDENETKYHTVEVNKLQEKYSRINCGRRKLDVSLDGLFTRRTFIHDTRSLNPVLIQLRK
uniref:Secreted protein n=1 Tax=Amblyomma cajennense TaxID=34607 RepID=A0A023FRA1_AMBCJ